MLIDDFECSFEAFAAFNDTSVPSLPISSIPQFPSASPSSYPDITIQFSDLCRLPHSGVRLLMRVF